MPGCRHPSVELLNCADPADLVELSVLAEHLGDRQMIDRAAPLVQREHRGEHRLVRLAVEVLGPQPLVGEQRGEVALVQQDRAEHRALGLQVMRRHTHADGARCDVRRWPSCLRLRSRAGVLAQQLVPELGVAALAVAHRLLAQHAPPHSLDEHGEQLAVRGELGERSGAVIAAVALHGPLEQLPRCRPPDPRRPNVRGRQTAAGAGVVARQELVGDLREPRQRERAGAEDLIAEHVVQRVRKPLAWVALQQLARGRQPPLAIGGVAAPRALPERRRPRRQERLAQLDPWIISPSPRRFVVS